ncbi:MAG: lipoprotein [Pseudomonadota bacterium]|nr:lipoprotein [Pseudomonadota bacterium]
MNTKLAIALIVPALLLAACGNKGPLVMAEPAQPRTAVEPEAGAVPVEVAPDPQMVGEGPIPIPQVPLEPDDFDIDDQDPPADDAGDPPDDDAGG